MRYAVCVYCPVVKENVWKAVQLVRQNRGNESNQRWNEWPVVMR